MKKCTKKIKFLAYAISEAQHLKANGRISVSYNHLCAYRRFEEYLKSVGKKDISFKKVTPQLLNDFEDFLKRKGICRNTSGCYLRSLGTVWNKAVREGLATGNPFIATYRGVGKTRKRAVNADVIRRLITFDIEAVLTDNGSKTVGKKLHQRITQLELARDLFLFSFCSRGITFVDMAYLRKSDVTGDTISYNRRKTGQHLEVRIEKPMRDILDRYPSTTIYQFPILTEEKDATVIYHQYKNAIDVYNRYLHKLGEMLGVPKLTSYVSRHSWATNARRNNTPTAIISQALGHDSEKTTEIYLKSFDKEVIDDTNKALLDQIFDYPHVSATDAESVTAQ